MVYLFNGPTLTVQGTYVETYPRMVNVNSQAKYVTGFIEMENGEALMIVDSTVRMESASPVSTQIGDRDKDGNPDLQVNFDLQEFIRAALPYVEQNNTTDDVPRRRHAGAVDFLGQDKGGREPGDREREVERVVNHNCTFLSRQSSLPRWRATIYRP